MEQVTQFTDEKIEDIPNPALEIARLREENEELRSRLEILDRAHEEIIEQRGEIEQMAIFDKLTGLYSRAFCQVEMQRFFAERVRSTENKRVGDDGEAEEAGLIFFDIDKFKTINDTYGHDVGDEVLAKVAGVIKSALRGHDLAVRWGGEEILGVLFGASIADTEIKADQIREDVLGLTFSNPDLKVTISAGVVTSSGFNDFDQMVSVADKALYEAKNTGRNRVVVSSNPQE